MSPVRGDRATLVQTEPWTLGGLGSVDRFPAHVRSADGVLGRRAAAHSEQALGEQEVDDDGEVDDEGEDLQRRRAVVRCPRLWARVRKCLRARGFSLTCDLGFLLVNCLVLTVAAKPLTWIINARRITITGRIKTKRLLKVTSPDPRNMLESTLI